jgi:predicted Zn finger-like uncharacterized protein
MLISCPECKTKFKFDEQKVSSTGVKLRCSKCSAVFRLASEAAAGSGQLTVLVAHESREFCDAVQKVLASEPFTLISCHDGKEALELIAKIMPDVVLLNVALPTMYGFQVSEALRSNPATRAVKIILLAAIYDKTKYKRAPQSLYGADDYIEQHHIPDSLAAMIYRLASDTKPVDSAQTGTAVGELEIPTAPEKLTRAEAAVQEQSRNELRSQELKEPTELCDKAAQAARQLARSIVSDISLYREEELEEGVRNGTVAQLLAVEIRDGRTMYEKRVPESVRFSVDYFEEALVELIEQTKRELGIS